MYTGYISRLGRNLLWSITFFMLATSTSAQEIRIHYHGDLARILDAARQAYVNNFPQHLDWIEKGQITIINCGRNPPIEVSDLPSGYTWTYDGYDSTQSLAWALDQYALMMASFSRSGIPYEITQDIFRRLETRFDRYRRVYFDGEEYKGFREALKENLPRIFQEYGIYYPGLYYLSECGGPVEVLFSTDPTGARVWRTTPLRANFCSIREQNEEECLAWNEVTGQGSLWEQGNIILYARWPDGRDVQSYRDLDNMPDPASIILRPD